ncbi:MAG: MEDS domain-containing protein [Nibricoccus sp.]
MNQEKTTISLGFTKERFPAGVHICQIFSDDDERTDALLRFVQSGLEKGERTSCFSDQVKSEVVKKHLECHRISFDEKCSCGTLTLAATRDVYFRNNCFDPDRMLGFLSAYHEESMTQGYPAARVMGEMSPEVQHISGGSRLLEYESKVSLLLREHPVTCVCQYDARKFDGAMILEILKVHPLMIIRGAVVRNPFFVPPEEYLSR